MANMGRPRKSAEEHKAEGTYRASRHANTGVKFNPAKNIPLPESINDAKTIEVWNQIIPALCEKDLVSIVEVPVLEYAFQCYQNAQECKNAVKKFGGVTAYLLELKREQRDLTKYERDYMSEFNSIMFKFGITPAENPKVRTAPNKENNAVNELSNLLGKM